MTKQELSVKIDRIVDVISEGYELLNDTGDYESEQLDKATCKAQDILEILHYFQKHELADG
jgi:uncharacterized protein YfbU (UPF0304 family)